MLIFFFFFLLENRWTKSETKKDGADENIAKYDGKKKY
jgi:hypothetical protein